MDDEIYRIDSMISYMNVFENLLLYEYKETYVSLKIYDIHLNLIDPIDSDKNCTIPKSFELGTHPALHGVLMWQVSGGLMRC